MTYEELQTVVGGILAAHLDAAYWNALDSTSKTAALKMARNDIFAELPSITLADIPVAGADENPVCLAIAEQAVYLARNYASDTAQGGKVVASESVDGLSMSYAVSANSNTEGFEISPRAWKYIAKAKKKNLADIRFTRG